MRKSILIFIFILTNGLFLHAQDTQTCGFEALFNIKAGMGKEEVMGLISKNYPAKLINTEVEHLPPYKGSGGGPITKETLSYTRDTTPCFNGRNTTLQLEFADNKLFKAYIKTIYPKSDYQGMVANYNSLRNVIKAKWAYEKGIKIAGDNTMGYGYNYTKTKSTNKKTEKVSLQYVDYKTNDPNSNYILEVLWANLSNTRMENSNY